MRRTAAFALMVALPIAGCALAGYNFDGYGPASTGEGGAPSSTPSSSGPSSSGPSSTGSSTAGSGGASGSSGGGGSPAGSTSSSASSASSSVGAGGGCTQPEQCPMGLSCQVPLCVNGVCGLGNKSMGAMCNTSGTCDDKGQCSPCADAQLDCGKNTDCTTFTCAAGLCGSLIVQPGTPCITNSGAGQCDSTGHCI